jgi:hypothetical protein
MVVSTKHQNIRIEVVNVGIATHKHYRIGFGVKRRCIYNLVWKQETTMISICVLMTYGLTTMPLEHLSTPLNFSSTNGIPFLHYI